MSKEEAKIRNELKKSITDDSLYLLDTFGRPTLYVPKLPQRILSLLGLASYVHGMKVEEYYGSTQIARDIETPGKKPIEIMIKCNTTRPYQTNHISISIEKVPNHLDIFFRKIRKNDKVIIDILENDKELTTDRLRSWKKALDTLRQDLASLNT